MVKTQQSKHQKNNNEEKFYKNLYSDLSKTNVFT
jgi:hypothetical protein